MNYKGLASKIKSMYQDKNKLMIGALGLAGIALVSSYHLKNNETPTAHYYNIPPEMIDQGKIDEFADNIGKYLYSNLFFESNLDSDGRIRYINDAVSIFDTKTLCPNLITFVRGYKNIRYILEEYYNDPGMNELVKKLSDCL